MQSQPYIEDPDLLTETSNAWRNLHELWAGVLLQAIKDYHDEGTSSTVQRDKRHAMAWFKSSRQDVGSFIWICDLLDLNSGLIRSRIKADGFKLNSIMIGRIQGKSNEVLSA
jgi:hypothetical protein